MLLLTTIATVGAIGIGTATQSAQGQSINYKFGDVDAHGATIRAQAASLEAEHQAVVRDVQAAGDFLTAHHSQINTVNTDSHSIGVENQHIDPDQHIGVDFVHNS